MSGGKSWLIDGIFLTPKFIDLKPIIKYNVFNIVPLKGV